MILKTAFDKLMFNVRIEGECWIKHSQHVKHDGEVWIAPRFSWMIFVGDIPDGLNICHHCDRPRCINPIHLFVGTQSENIQDAISKGRFHPRFNPQPGVSPCHVHKIRRRTIWSHLGDRA